MRACATSLDLSHLDAQAALCRSSICATRSDCWRSLQSTAMTAIWSNLDEDQHLGPELLCIMAARFHLDGNKALSRLEIRQPRKKNAAIWLFPRALLPRFPGNTRRNRYPVQPRTAAKR